MNPLSTPPAQTALPDHAVRAAVVACVAVLAACAFVSPALAADSALSPQPTAVSFSDQDVHGGVHENASISFTNSGGSDVTVSSVAIAGADLSQFNVTSEDCNGATVTGGKSCQVDVEFVPTTRGAKSATLSIVDDSGTVDVPLTGSGITGTLTADPSPFLFNPQPWFFGGQQQNITLIDSADAGVQVTSAAITGPDAGLFYIAYGDNCASQTYKAGSSCGMGIGFNPLGPGTFHAQLEITSDSALSPLVVPIAVTALTGPHSTISPRQLAFGNVAIGQERTMAGVVTNDGDAPMQVQQLLFITGRPDVFFVTGDTCTGKSIDPGKSCQVLVHFKPSSGGEKEASLFFITGNGNQPVFPVGVNGTGVASPDGAASVHGRAIAGGELTCAPVGFPAGTTYDYRWLRNGSEVTGATGSSLGLSDDDIGSSFACRVHATNAVGTRTVTSAETARVAARELESQRDAFVDRWACRTIAAPSVLSVGGRRVTVRYGHPFTPAAPLTLRSKRSLTASVDGHRIGQGRRVKVGPAALSAVADGAHSLTVTAGGAIATARLVLAPCRLALRARGGRDRGASIAISARTGIRSLRVKLPRALRIARTRKHTLGSLKLERAGLPDVSFILTGKRTRFNGITVTLTQHGLRVTGLPDNVGVLRFRLQRRVLNGRGGNVRVQAALMGEQGLATASARSHWQR